MVARGDLMSEEHRSGDAEAEAPEVPAFDLQPDVERLHRPISREPHDPVEGREPVPWYFIAAIALTLFWGGWYLGRYSGEFGLATHVSLAGRDAGTVASVREQTEGAIADPVAAGQRIYSNNCASCHQASGEGIPGAFPPLAGSEWVTGSPEVLTLILLHGMHGPVEVAGQTYNSMMPAWQDLLKDEEIAAVATFLRQMGPNSASPVSVQEVNALRTLHADRTSTWTAEEVVQAEVSTGVEAPASDTPDGGA